MGDGVQYPVQIKHLPGNVGGGVGQHPSNYESCGNSVSLNNKFQAVQIGDAEMPPADHMLKNSAAVTHLSQNHNNGSVVTDVKNVNHTSIRMQNDDDDDDGDESISGGNGPNGELAILADSFPNRSMSSMITTTTTTTNNDHNNVHV